MVQFSRGQQQQQQRPAETTAAMAWRISMRRELDKVTQEVRECAGRLSSGQASTIEGHLRQIRQVLKGPLAEALMAVQICGANRNDPAVIVSRPTG